jgi:glutaminase
MLYCAALEELGENKVHSHVGREPSGLSFNELTLNKGSLPHNPMINAGAIMASSLIRRDEPMADRLDYMRNLIAALSGQRLPHFNNAIFHSERETADRNFALAHYMREVGAFPEDADIFQALDYYFSACSLEVTAKSMSTIAATLANGGVCPQTGERVFSQATVKNCLSMMYSCGMYDYSGEFAFSVGIPAKSSVSGVIMAIIPNVMGIAVWSPRLDECGNSVRGVEFLKGVISRFNFHNYDSLVESEKLDPRRRKQSSDTNRTFTSIYAASIGDINELKRLVAHGHDLDSADYDGRTPLHLAAAEGQLEAVVYLLDQGVMTEPKDRWSNTPLDDAVRHKQDEVVELLAAQSQVVTKAAKVRARQAA